MKEGLSVINVSRAKTRTGFEKFDRPGSQGGFRKRERKEIAVTLHGKKYKITDNRYPTTSLSMAM